ncbi:AAA family ATPase [Sphingomonas oryzagri]|uniref:MoxR family ATPase n=1 Tax=Sphingomonas oryzagri TaxID=3042314 RepID=A0ABT6N0C4_9SPHN|nr:MoxR family ATPase [Sphingomonas oryzagri]MDH7638755.1 MoxR family ATPase [Sphingomonas oryzagri]
MTLDEVKGLGERIAGEIGKAVVGQEATVRHLLIALFSGGHVLLEGPPGTAKTFLAQCFAATLGLDFKRIQFTPDLMPGDITGSNVFNFQTSSFSHIRGPVFCDLLLSDEINRAPPKTQAALLEAMQERSVTLDGVSHPLSDRFMVVATQNPIENQGVYPLPEAQLDRFLFKLLVDYPDEAEEIRIVAGHGKDRGTPSPTRWGVTQQADSAAIGAALEAVSTVTLVDEVVAYIVRLIRATRTSVELTAGASPRAAAMLAGAARAAAALSGRDYVVPDDVRALAPAVLRHRIALSPTAEIDGRKPEEVVATLIAETVAPR